MVGRLYTRRSTGAAAWATNATPSPMWDVEGSGMVPIPNMVSDSVTEESMHCPYEMLRSLIILLQRNCQKFLDPAVWSEACLRQIKLALHPQIPSTADQNSHS